MEKWTAQYPALLPKNFLGIVRTWDEAKPARTQRVLPNKNTPFNFMWRYGVEPGELAPYVEEYDETPLTSAMMSYESFICREAREGFAISERELTWGIEDVVLRRSHHIVDAINRRMEWECARALGGQNDFQNVDRLNRISVPAGSEWDQAGSDPIGDILSMKNGIERACSIEPNVLLLPWNEYEYLQEHSDVIDQIKYTDPTFLAKGRITTLKNLELVVLGGFWKSQAGVRSYILEDRCIMCAAPVGFTGIAEPKAGAGPETTNWHSENQRAFFYSAWKSFVPVIEDYAKIGIINNTDSTVTRY